jgi:multicomponent Na+:H+ antiporter subunit B
MPDLIVKTITRILFPFIVLYGVFIVWHGHISPGGGFSGGAIIGGALILYTLVYGIDATLEKFSHRVSSVLESGGLMIILVIGLVSMALGYAFLETIPELIELGTPGALISAGLMPVIMIAIAMKVTSTMISLFHALIEED